MTSPVYQPTGSASPRTASPASPRTVSPLLPQPAVIQEIRRETADTQTYTLAFADEGLRERFSFRPGQFNMLTLWGAGEAAVSFSSDPALRGQFQHTIRAVGNVTRAMARFSVGDVVGLRGPYGRAWPLEEMKGKDVLVVAGGIGLAPVRPAILHLFRHRSDYGRITLLYGARTPADLLYTDQYDEWRAQPDTTLLLSVDRADGVPWPHQVGVVTTLFPLIEFAPGNTVALVCGPEIMMRFVAVDLLRRGLSPERLFVSLERRMKCAVGQCGHCMFGPKFVCREGPVFRYAEVEPFFGKRGV
ncbi:MAG: FAD/NAD(P)-binding protein [Firmicutes bacterium]|nr:FAD/NAD(P)-binding protein [Bacillota bacterium]